MFACVCTFFFLESTYFTGIDWRFSLVQDGSILAWKFNAATNSFEPAASLKGHTLGVVSLVVGANRLYSGSMDCSIRVSWFQYCIYSLHLIFLVVYF